MRSVLRCLYMTSDLRIPKSLCLKPLILTGGLDEATVASSSSPRSVCIRCWFFQKIAQRPSWSRVFINRSESGETSRVSITREVNAEITVSLSPPITSGTATFNPRYATFFMSLDLKFLMEVPERLVAKKCQVTLGLAYFLQLSIQF